MVDRPAPEGVLRPEAFWRLLCRSEEERFADLDAWPRICGDAWERVGLRPSRPDPVLAPRTGSVGPPGSYLDGQHPADARRRDWLADREAHRRPLPERSGRD